MAALKMKHLPSVQALVESGAIITEGLLLRAVDLFCFISELGRLKNQTIERLISWITV